MKKLKGVISVIITPFTEDGSNIDFDDLRRLVDALVEEGVDGLALPGVASEFYKISDAERSRMIEVVADQANGRVPVVVNITRNSTELAIKDAREAKAAGADAVMVVPPWFVPPSGAAVVEHVEAIAQSVDLPIVIQYAPNVTGAPITTDTFLDLADRLARDVYIKAESVPPGPLVSTIVERTSGRMGVFIGNGGAQMFDALERGAAGVMPGSAIVRPFVEIYRSYTDGDKEKAFRLFNHLLPILNVTTQSAEMYVACEKKMLKARGIFKSDRCRRPCHAVGPEVDRLLERYDRYMREHFGYGWR